MKLRRNLFVLLFASTGLLSAPFQVSARSTVVLDFESLAHTDEFISVPSPHREGGLTVTSSVTVGSPTFTVFGPDDSRFAGSANLLSISVSEWNPRGCRNCNPP